MATPPETPHYLPSDVLFESAARKALIASFRKMRENGAGTRAGLERRTASPQEVEALHDMRVGSRRLRAALEVFGAVFAKEDLRFLQKEVGAITDALGAVRDLDVQLSFLRELETTIPANEAYGIGRLILRQTKRRNRERKALLIALDRMEKDGFSRQFRVVIARTLPKKRGEDG